MKILGQPFSLIRNEPGKRPFTRPKNSKDYLAAVSSLKEIDNTNVYDLFDAGVEETNQDSESSKSSGAVKLIAFADEIILRYKEAKNITESDIEAINKAVRAYHFAGNTFRQLQQFELSADYYLISARVGLALASSKVARQFSNAETFQSCLKIADRSYMRARAVYKETGFDEKIETVFVESRDLRFRQAMLKGNTGKAVSFFLWKTLSGYGTSIGKLFISFFISTMILGAICFLFIWDAADKSFLYAEWESFVVLMGGDRNISSSNAFLDGLLQMLGVFWATLLGQLILQRVAARI